MVEVLVMRTLDRPTVNRTGLKGKYDFDLVWQRTRLSAAATSRTLRMNIALRQCHVSAMVPSCILRWTDPPLL